MLSLLGLFALRVSLQDLPEPAEAALIGLGLAVLGVRRRKRIPPATE